MTTLGQLRKTIRTATELGDLVGTMETLAAVNIRQYESTLRAIDDYVVTIELGFQILLERAPGLVESAIEESDRKRLGAVVFGSDQGLCGAINSRATRRTDDALRNVENSRIVAVGHRVAQGLVDHDIELEHEMRPPHAVSGITNLVAELLNILGDWQDDESVDHVAMIFNRPRMLARDSKRVGAGYDTVMQTILPLDRAWLENIAARPWQSKCIPDFADEPQQLFSWLVREWLFSRIYLACAASLAAENASRLEATHAANRSIEERLHELKNRYRRLRQSTITEELMDLYR